MLGLLPNSSMITATHILTRLTRKVQQQTRKLSITEVRNFKQNLPHLPVPNLADTLRKYLRSVQPLLTEEEFKATKKVVEEFGKDDGEGLKLQSMLLEKAKDADNWLDPWWLETAYLRYRVPVVVHSSPGLVFPFQTFTNKKDYLKFVSRLIVGILEYKLEIEHDKIPLEKFGKHVLDMSQYKRLFGTCRIPAPVCDKLAFNPTTHHIIVAHRNHFFRVRLFCDKNERLNEEQIHEQLKKLVAESEEYAPAIGILSSDHRDKWAENYALLTKDPANEPALDIIRRALFVICLDEPALTGQDVLAIAGHQCIHGGGSEHNSGNRWFDKTVQFIISKDGILGVCYEHSPSEGQPVAVMTDYIVNYLKAGKRKGPKARGSLQTMSKLEFNITSEIKKAIQDASRKLDKLINDLELECMHFTHYGKEFVKGAKMSPDSYFQMGIQYGYYRLHQQPGPQYESASTRMFKNGRTETIRSCCVESVAFAKAMLSKELNQADKYNLLGKAVLAHKKLSVEANTGHGIDRHLLGLKMIAMENQVELPDLFNDKGFLKSSHFVISSSQVATKCSGVMVYGPTCWDGYGLCYNLRAHDIYYGVTAFHSNRKTSALHLKTALETSLKDMRIIIKKNR